MPYNHSIPTLDTPARESTAKAQGTQNSNASQGTAEPVDEAKIGYDALANRLYATLGIDQGVVSCSTYVGFITPCSHCNKIFFVKCDRAYCNGNVLVLIFASTYL